MQEAKEAGLYEFERREYHAARPGFRITELQIGPKQKVPWHTHSHVHDTFYVLSGSIRIFLQDPKEDVRLSRARHSRSRPKDHTSSRTPAKLPPSSSSCRASANTISYP